MFRDEGYYPDARAISVLHVEDDSLVADAIRITLDDEGWSVETCANGAAVLERLTSGARSDVLIFDNKLQDTIGAELIRRTRTLAHRHQTPIIMLSGDDVEAQARANVVRLPQDDVPLIAETVVRLLARNKGREACIHNPRLHRLPSVRCTLTCLGLGKGYAAQPPLGEWSCSRRLQSRQPLPL